jgi:hypothetical protein
MRSRWFEFALWAGAGVLLVSHAAPCCAQPGPDDGGAVLRNPFDDPAPRPVARSQSAAPGLADANGSAGYEQFLAQLSVDPRYSINDDIRAKPELGPWMVCVHSYVTKDAPEFARQMASELRSTYKLPAYVFTYGLEERQKEYERVKDLLAKQREFFKGRELPYMYSPRAKEGPTVPMLSNDIPLEYAKTLLKDAKQIQLQCAVVIGGYQSQDAAHRAADAIHKLPQPDPNKVKLDVRFYGEKQDPMDVNLKFKSGAAEYVNPFKKAFVCRNPSIKQDSNSQSSDALDINVLRRLNADESYSLLNCKKPITLAIKQFQTYTAVASRDDAPSILEKLGLKTRAGEGIDQAAHDAHVLADLLRKNKKLDAYVLHTKYSSVVTVGGYDSLEDPGLRATQSMLGSHLREWSSLMFFAEPRPMRVPQ